MRANGYGGELRVGYQRAARLGTWYLEVVQAVPAIRFSVGTSIVASDGFWITQRPMTLDLQFGRFHWCWDAVLKIEIENEDVQLVVYGKPRIVKDGEV